MKEAPMPTPTDKEITVYPTYGYRDKNGWKIPMRVWVHKQRRIDAVPDSLVREIVDDDGSIKEEEARRCRDCIADLVADDDSGESVTFRLGDHTQVYTFSAKTDANGIVEQVFEAPGDFHGWLTVTAEVTSTLGGKSHGGGRVRLLEPTGKSVVSDIDDTIKVSEIPASGRIVLRNTFLRPYVAAEGMLDRYRGFGDVAFHYVSGSPWQLFRLLHTFLVEESGFPAGTFHMKSLRKNPLDPKGFIRDVKNFVAGKEYTKQQKIEQISGLMRNLPGRRFTLIGDSGELDPEVFIQVKALFPDCVEKIMIRDVVGAKVNDPGRLPDEIEVIDAPLVTRGKSQFA
jgi:phosphatidate phosphatase APP1